MLVILLGGVLDVRGGVFGGILDTPGGVLDGALRILARILELLVIANIQRVLRVVDGLVERTLFLGAATREQQKERGGGQYCMRWLHKVLEGRLGGIIPTHLDHPLDAVGRQVGFPCRNILFGSRDFRLAPQCSGRSAVKGAVGIGRIGRVGGEGGVAPIDGIDGLQLRFRLHGGAGAVHL